MAKFLDETGLATVWAKAVGKFVKVATGSYYGTDKYGTSNPNSLTFDFKPKIVIIYSDAASSAEGSYGNSSGNNFMIFVNYKTLVPTSSTNVLGYNVYVKFNGNTVSWYSSTSSTCQANGATGPSSSITYTHYRYVAVGI